jgi:hypothetical protein
VSAYSADNSQNSLSLKKAGGDHGNREQGVATDGHYQRVHDGQLGHVSSVVATGLQAAVLTNQ